MASAAALVGRAEELALIRDALASPAGAFALTGDAGVGKTEIARAALAEAERQGHPTHWIAATSALAVVPYGAVAHLVRPEQRAAEPQTLASTIVDDLAEGADRRVVVVTDDAGYLDAGSSELVAQL